MARSTNKLLTRITPPELPVVTRSAGGWPLQIDHVEEFAWAPNVFNPEEITAIINIGNACNIQKAGTFGPQSDEVRNSSVSFIYPNEMTNWIFSRVAGLINEMNARYFKFDLYSLEQGLQFTHYKAPDQHYTWHVDRGRQTGTRKLSVSIQLSDPSEYEGGELELWYGGEPVKIHKEKAMSTLFPSYVLHRVAPVTKGERYSLVAWVSGPPFK